MLGRNRQTRHCAAAGLVGALAVVGAWALVAATAWAPPAATAEPRPFTQFGIGGTAVLRTTSDAARRATAWTAVDDVGASWIRVDVQWDAVERVRGQYDWAQLDRIVSGASAANLRVLALVHRTPKWARPTGNRAPTHPPVSASALQGYSTFMTRLAQRYTRPGARRIHAVEVWNEPNIPEFWSGGINPERYVALLKKAFVAVNAVNSATTVMTAGLAPAWDTRTTVNPRSYLRRIYGLGARNYFDAVGMHPYSYPYLPSQTGYNGWGNMIKAHGDRPSMRATMEANGDGAKQILGDRVRISGGRRGRGRTGGARGRRRAHVGHLSVGRAVLLLLAPRRGLPDGRAPAQRRQPSSRLRVPARRHRRSEGPG